MDAITERQLQNVLKLLSQNDSTKFVRGDGTIATIPTPTSLHLPYNVAIQADDSGGTARRIVISYSGSYYFGDIDLAATGYLYLSGSTATPLTLYDKSNNGHPLFGFIRGYESIGQTITAGGALQLTHGLKDEAGNAVAPNMIQVWLKCIDAGGEGGYVQNDTLPVAGIDYSSTNYSGVAVVPDATNLNIRYCDSASTFSLFNKTTGAAFQITNSKWMAVFRAFYIKMQ